MSLLSHHVFWMDDFRSTWYNTESAFLTSVSHSFQLQSGSRATSNNLEGENSINISTTVADQSINITIKAEMHNNASQ